jgi:hypothetical protein
VQIKQVIPADGWYVIRRDFQSPGLPANERVWHYPLCAFAVVEEDGEARLDGVEVLGNELLPASEGAEPGEYWEFVRGEEALEEALEKHYKIWREKPWQRSA